MDNEAINKALHNLWVTRQKVARSLDTFPAYHCPKCKQNVGAGVGAVILDVGDESFAFCKWCYAKQLKETCGLVQFVATNEEKEDKGNVR